jgi:hypothetical protein
MAGTRSTSLETERRVFTIQGWIITGVPDYLILKNIEQQFGVCRRQSKNLLKKAYTIWVQDQEATIEQKRALKIAKLKQEIRSMGEEYKFTPKGMAVKLSYEKEINKLEGIYHAKQMVIKGDKENPVVITDDYTPEKEARLNKLIEKVLQLKKE